MATPFETANIYRRGGRVERYHTEPTIHRQTVAEHCYYVALLVWQLGALMDPPVERDDVLNVMFESLFHDLAEQHTGDIPAVAKWENPELAKGLDVAERRWLALRQETHAEFSHNEAWLFKLADTVELLFFCLAERRMGNREVDIIFMRAWDKIIRPALNNERSTQALRGFLFDLQGAYKETVRYG